MAIKFRKNANTGNNIQKWCTIPLFLEGYRLTRPLHSKKPGVDLKNYIIHLLFGKWPGDFLNEQGRHGDISCCFFGQRLDGPSFIRFEFFQQMLHFFHCPANILHVRLYNLHYKSSRLLGFFNRDFFSKLLLKNYQNSTFRKLDLYSRPQKFRKKPCFLNTLSDS